MDEVQKRLFLKMANIVNAIAFNSNCNTGNAERNGGIIWKHLHELNKNVQTECKQLGLPLTDASESIWRSLEFYDPVEAEAWKNC